MEKVIYDVSSFLHSYSEKNVRTVGGLPIAGLEKLLVRVLENRFSHNILVLDSSSGGPRNKDTDAYKGRRDNKSYEIRRLEDFIQAFFSEIGVSVIVADSDVEADDVIYTLSKKLAATNSEALIFADDIDLSACVINESITKRSVSVPKPDVTRKTYESSVERTFIPHNMVAFYVATEGKKSDNIPPMPDRSGVLLECFRAINDKANKSILFKNVLKHASELKNFLSIVDMADGLSDSQKDELKNRAKYVCCQDTGTEIPYRVIPTEGKIYAALVALNSRVRPRDGEFDRDLRERMSLFLGDNEVSEIGLGMGNSEIDLSDFDLPMSEVFGSAK